MANINLRVQQIGKPISSIIISHKAKMSRLTTELMQLGKDTYRFMIDYIASHTKTAKEMPQSDAQPLVDTIDYNEYAGVSGFGWSIGNIDKLNRSARQWAIINYGGKHPQAGKKIPGAFAGSNLFIYAPYSGQFITVGVNTIIKPMDYIQVTRNYLDKSLKRIVRKFAKG